MEPRVKQVRLQGVTLEISTTHDDETLERIVRYADQKLGEITRAGVGSPQQAALIALLCLSEEVLEERSRLEELKERIRAKSANILDMLGSQGSLELEQGESPPGGGIGI